MVTTTFPEWQETNWIRHLKLKGKVIMKVSYGWVWWTLQLSCLIQSGHWKMLIYFLLLQLWASHLTSLFQRGIIKPRLPTAVT